MKYLLLVLSALLSIISNNLVWGFAAPFPKGLSRTNLVLSAQKIVRLDTTDSDTISKQNALSHNNHTNAWLEKAFTTTGAVGTVAVVLSMAAPAEAANGGGVLPSALWAYAHYVSILAITGLLVAERTTIKANMTIEEEDAIVKLDLAYGLMAALLIGSGFARASNYGKGGDYYLHETLFWVKMTFAGVWGGLSLFPSLTFYKRKFARKSNETPVPPVSDKLAARLHQIINAEITAILSIPLFATLMARGVGYSPDFPWPLGAAAAIAGTGGSFYLYAKQALTWTEDEEVAVPAKEE